MRFSCRPSRVWILCFVLGCAISSCVKPRPTEQSSSSDLNYPPARRAPVMDDYHGTQVADPYRWLEDAESAETRAWVQAQNRITHRYLQTQAQARIKVRLEEVANYAQRSAPIRRGDQLFFWQNQGLQNHFVLMRQSQAASEALTVLDPNRLSKDGTAAVTQIALSATGRFVAYLVSERGSDWQQLRVRVVETGEDLPEVIDWCRFSSVAWLPDESGFFYDRFPDPATVAPAEDSSNSRVFFHRVGTAVEQDRLVFAQPQHKDRRASSRVTEDGRFLVLSIEKGTDPKNRIYIQSLSGNKELIRLLDDGDANYRYVGHQGGQFIFHTDLDAPRGRLIAIDSARPQRQHWREIVGQQKDVIGKVTWTGGRLVVSYMHHAANRLEIYGLAGGHQGGIDLPGLGSVTSFSGRQDDPELFFEFESFVRPSTIYRYHFAQARQTVFFAPKVPFDLDAYQTRQVFYLSKDGTRIPMFVTHRRGLKLDGRRPTLLTGYGGFNVNKTPKFSSLWLPWLERGGVYALANLRGGSEYGESWHQAGILANKQNVFDDFIAAATWLIDQGYTNPRQLASSGGSNGGLLTAVCLLQRPDLFGAVVSRVPVIDMLRYHRFTIGRFWVSDYGNAEKSAEHFAFLYAYSPLHNIRAGHDYPATLITTAEGDDRVVPMHGKKFAAALQAAASGSKPILLRVETGAGHGRGKPLSKKIEEQADILTFLFRALEMNGFGSGLGKDS